MRDLPVDENYYEKVLNNFEQFCDEFEGAASQRFSGVDNAGTSNTTGVPSSANQQFEEGQPAVVREIDEVGEDDILARATAIDVPSTEVTET